MGTSYYPDDVRIFAAAGTLTFAATATGAAGPSMSWGAGAPATARAAGSLYMRTNGSLYINTTGLAGGWVLVSDVGVITGDVLVPDSDTLTFGTGLDVVATANGTDVVWTQGAGLGAWVFGDSLPVNFGTGKDIVFTPDGTNVVLEQGAGAGLLLMEAGAFRIADTTDNTKRAAWDASAITAGQTRTLTLPDQNVNLTPVLRGASTAASTTISNTMARTVFSTTVTLPANSLAVGDVVRITGWGTVARAAMETFILDASFGGVALAATAAIGAAGDFRFQAELTVRALGAAGVGAIASGCLGTIGTSSSADSVVETAAIDTTVANAVGIAVTMSAAATGTTAVLQGLVVERLRN